MEKDEINPAYSEFMGKVLTRQSISAAKNAAEAKQSEPEPDFNEDTLRRFLNSDS